MSNTSNALPELIRERLTGLRSRMRRRFLLHGGLWTLCATTLVLLAHYTIDRNLDLPAPIRLLLLGAALVYLAFGVQRRLLAPLKVQFADRDIALWVERNHPELHQELVSAVQLGSGPLPADSSEQLVHKLIEDVAERLRGMRFDGLLRSDRTRRVGLGASLGLGLLFGAAALSPEGFGVWLQRLLGASTPYPRASFLSIEVPPSQANVAIRADVEGEALQVDVARGSDLPINVEVVGKVPDFVELVVRPLQGGNERILFMTRRGERRFRYVLRRVLEDSLIYARGGDDPGTRRIETRILVPPAASGLQVLVTPPTYTRLAPIRSEGGLVEALPGSDVRVLLRASTELVAAELEFQESSSKVPLQRVDALPSDKAESSEDVESIFRYEARFNMPSSADRYQISMRAKNGLSGLGGSVYSVVPKPDHRPVVRVVTPGPSFPAMTPDAVFPLRLSATDDYGLTQLRFGRRLGSRGELAYETLWSLSEEDADSAGQVRTRFDSLRLLSPQQLFANKGGSETRAPREGDRLEFAVTASDNRAPDAQQSLPRAFRIDLVALDELRRRLQSRLRSTRRAVERTRGVQEEQRARIASMLSELSSGAGIERLGYALTAAEAGQQRVRSSLSRVRSDFCEVLDAHLFNALDSSPASKSVVEAYLSWYGREIEAKASDPRFWAYLQNERQEGRIGQLELLGRLCNMFALTHKLVEAKVPESLRILAGASTAQDDAMLQAAFGKLLEAQQKILEELQRLLTLLDDWNEYQDVIRMTRQIRDSLKDLMDRVEGDFGKQKR
ncbi:MAG: hypothetical protein CSA62_10225 [Planctomycetota bacterium]|nr:MAG: hypothetical protein CSA62_10225 [Planctomycetota bacterium]